MTFLGLLITIIVMADSSRLYTSDKLSSSLINCVTQDKYGFMWIGTEYGLSKFDGYKFTNYLHNNKDTTSIADNIISSFLVDKEGRLWIGCAKGLMRYNATNDNFIQYHFPDGRKPRIYDIIESRNGDILMGTAGFGLYSIKRCTDKIKYEKQYSTRDSNMFYTHIFEDSHGYLWQGSHLNRFTRFSKYKNKVKITYYDSPCGAPVNFYQDWKNSMMIVCMFGIVNYDYTTGKITDAGYNFGPYKGNITINCSKYDKNGNLYIGTSECGVLMAPAGSKTFKAFENSNSSKFDLSTSWVNDIYEDKNQNIWIGCYKKGLFLLNNQKMAFNSWSFSDQNYSIGSSVSSLAQESQGSILCTVQNSGVYKFNNAGKIVSHPKSPAGTSIIYQDKWGRYWVGTGNALYSYNPENGNYKQEMKFASAGIYCITDDGMGKLYISVYSKGLYIYDSKTHKVKVLDMSMTSPHGMLCNDWIRSLSFDRQGLLWIGTSNGVACLNTQSYTFDNYGWTCLLRNFQANYLCEDEWGNMIIGTDKGLYIYYRGLKKLAPFPNSYVLRNKQICGIVRDSHNNIWVSTTMGIWEYDHHAEKFIAHINGNGLSSHEYMLGAVLHSADGRIGFGNTDGITTFYPYNVVNDITEMGNVHLTNFIIYGKHIDCTKSEYEIPYSENSFTLEFSLLNYKNAEDISYQYRINRGEWNSTDEGINSIPFNKLNPGNYQIEVRACCNGIVSKDTRIINITIESPWYATSWAYLIYAALISILVYFIFRYYERRRVADFEEQKMRFLINATHDIRSPLTLIMSPLEKLKHKITDIDSLAEINIIDRNAQRLLLLVNQILDERKIDKKQMQLHCTETNLVEFTRGIIALYAYNAKERNITITLESSEKKINVWIDRINFDKIINNLMSNAMKYTFDNGTINVYLSCDSANATLKVTDSGIGIKNEDAEKLFDRFYQGTNTTGFHIPGTGIGLNLCKALVNMHGGNIKAYNRGDGQKGTCMEINIPLGNAHLKPEEITTDNKDDSEEIASQGHKKNANKDFKILIVDDDHEIASYVMNELGSWYKFDYAANGREGLSKLLSSDFNLVISDVMMPEMDGITMLKKIKGNSKVSDIPVILLTSKSDIENRLEGLKRGADAFLAKPFSMEELHILIDNLVDNVRRLKGKFSGALEQEDKIENIEVKGNNALLMDKVMKCINENISDPDFNVEKLVENVGMSRAQLHRKLKEITGVSTGEFIRNLRLEQAAHLIMKGEINISQVAYAVGFNNQTHFSTVFKKHFGVAPSEYYETKHKE